MAIKSEELSRLFYGWIAANSSMFVEDYDYDDDFSMTLDPEIFDGYCYGLKIESSAPFENLAFVEEAATEGHEHDGMQWAIVHKFTFVDGSETFVYSSCYYNSWDSNEWEDPVEVYREEKMIKSINWTAVE